MSNPVERMKNLVNYLPGKDIILGKKFIEVEILNLCKN